MNESHEQIHRFDSNKDPLTDNESLQLYLFTIDEFKHIFNTHRDHTHADHGIYNKFFSKIKLIISYFINANTLKPLIESIETVNYFELISLYRHEEHIGNGQIKINFKKIKTNSS